MNLGLGTLHFSPEILDSNEFKNLIEFCIQNNINYFDTGFYYGKTLTESFLGAALSSFSRDSYEIVVKYIFNKEYSFDEMLAIQFQRLNITYTDNLLLHNLTDKNISFYLNFLDSLERSKTLGLTKKIGFSSHLSPKNLEIFLRSKKWDVVYLYLNWMDYYANTASEEYELCKKYEVPVIAMGPLRGGKILTLPEKYNLELKKIHPDWSIVDWSLGWFNSLSNCEKVLTGALSLDELNKNLEASKKKLNSFDLNFLRDIAFDYKKEKLVPCTSCNYCIYFCPKKIKIPIIIKNYNRFIYEEEKNPRWLSNWLEEDHVLSDISRCMNCKQCEQVCPQKINISKEIKAIESYFNPQMQ